MKFLGVLLLLFLILGVVVGAVAYFSFRNFDPNMFRAEFEKQLSRQTGFRVELGDVQLQWGLQPQLEVAGLKFYHPQSAEKILQSGPVRIDLDLTAILQKHFGVSEIMIQSPEVFLRRGREGIWNWEIARGSTPSIPAAVSADHSRGGLIPVAEAAEAPQRAPAKDVDRFTQGWEVGFGKILIQDATVHFTDETVEPAYRLDIEKLEAEAREPSLQKAFHFTAGGTIFHATKRNLEVEGDLDLVAQSLDFSLRYGPETAMLKGRLKVLKASPHFEGTIEVRDLDMESVTPAAYKKSEHVTGRLSVKAQIALDGANPDALKRSLQGQGTAEILDGALRNRNLIKEVFDRLSPAMAVTSALGGELPPEMNEMLADRDTPFQSLKVACEVQAGIVKVGNFRLSHSNYQLSGQGTYGLLDDRISSALQLMLSKSISAYLMKKIREMELLADGVGQVVIPFRYSGVFPNASAQPDLNYIGAKLLQGGADQLLDRGLEQLSKYLERKKKK
ncbi:MAG: AsmA family protein [Candidatus Omnitrophota bacterium]